MDHGCLGVWLVPVDNYVNEYSSNNYIAYNTYYKKHYALIQSPQIQKEAAAIALGDNFRIVDCFRAERTDFSHSSIFQQLDVELVDRDENETRMFAESLIKDCIRSIHGKSLVCLGSFRQCDLLKWYGTDEPNLSSGCYIADSRTIILPNMSSSVFHQIECFVSACPGTMRLEDGRICMEKDVGEGLLFEVWNAVSRMIPLDSETIHAYWLINLPLARINSEGQLQPIHHIMSKPLLDTGLESLSLFQFSDEQLCRIPSKSYDLMLCSLDHVVEVIGGDMRIESFNEQLDAIMRFGLDPANYAFLLETLHINDINQHSLLSGFAMGIDRLAQFLVGKFDMDKVQLFPTNLPEGKMIHAMSLEDAGIL
jgi:aspartyl-tRNA synthetase